MRKRHGATPWARGAGRLALLLLLAGVRIARAQSSSEPQLVFTIYGGLSEGSALWRVPIQPLLAPGAQQDTVGLARRLRPGLVTGLVTTYFRSPHFGWSVDIAYFGIGSEQGCQGPATYKPDPQNENDQVCTRANGQHVGTNVVGFLAGATYRFAPEGHVQPFLRVTAGPGLIGNSSYFETTGIAVLTNPTGCQLGCTVTILQDTEKKQLTWVVNLAAGASVWLASAYRLRMEARDIITRLPIAAGPRDPLSASAAPPTGSVVKHLPTFLFGLDILLERRHTRRY
jgi:hypothetical protein